MPAPNYGISEYYTGEAGEKYFAQQKQSFASQVNLQFFLPYISADSSVLDFGCGGGDLLSLIPAKKRVGIEVNPAAQAHARSRGLLIFTELSEVEGCEFDTIITSHALEHVPSPYHALVELRKVLKSNGTLIWLSPLDDWRSRVNRQWRENNHDMHLYTWTPQTIGNLLVTAGYSPRQIRLLTHAVPPRVGKQLWKMNRNLFGVAAWLSAVILKRRQLLVIAQHASA